MSRRSEQAPGAGRARPDDPGRGAGEPSPAPGRGIPSTGDGSPAAKAPAGGPAEPGAPAPAEEEQGRPEGAVAEEARAPQREAEAVEHDIDELVGKARERDEYLSLAQRTQADFENYRKRASRDLSAAEARGVAKLARELLPALEGIRLVAAELSAALARVGIEAYSPEGERFDPALHEAMAQQPVEGAESGTIVEVYQQGYRADGIVLRPARVVVAA
jgi:molecular chaperone GrpE